MTAFRWQQIEKVYNAVLERDNSRRAAFIAEACGGDADLRNEVESLLAMASSTSGTLDRAAWEGAPEFTVREPLAVKEGTRIGAYSIEALIGVGGMGSVYRATDTRLNRTVAIKFLFDNAGDAAAAQAFRREAQFASSLNHPNIVTVHDVGEFESRQYLVTEFVDGGTLRDWAKHEDRTWQQLVNLLAGVAEGLAAAHDAGILHRDIKPANILVARNGYAKLADFGLAKLADSPRESGIAGTINYMSPEQAAGAPLDARSDIYSFGLVLGEMTAQRRQVPAELNTAVERALAKDPANRYSSIRELALDLRRLLRPVAPFAAPWRRTVPWVGFALLCLGSGLWVTVRRAPGPANPLADATFTRLTDFEGTQTNPAISPDGRSIAFLSDKGGTFDIWLRKIGGESVNLTHGRAGDLLAPLRSIGFSGDGLKIWNGGGKSRRLRLIPVTGGVFQNFLDEKAAEAAWSPDGKRLVYHSWSSGDAIFVANGDGGNVQPLVPAAPLGEHQHFPTWSLDGRWIWFARGRPDTGRMDLWRVLTEGGGVPERMTQRPSDAAYPTPIDGRTVLYVAHDESGAGPWLWALDTKTREPRRVSVGVEQYSSLAASADGHRLVASLVSSQVNLWSVPILDRAADERMVKPFPLPTTRALTPRFGGGKLFYISSRGGADGLWSYRNGHAVEIWKGSDSAVQSPPAISPDGRRVVIAIRRDDRVHLYVIAADGGQLRALAADIDVRGTSSWSPDGKWVVTGGAGKTGTSGLFKIAYDGGEAVRIVSGNALDPVWSPDGDLIVYEGTNTYTDAPLLGVRSDGTRVELPPISVRREGERARFLPNGTGLIYMQGPSRKQDFWLLDLKTMKQRALTQFSNPALMRTFDVTPDGRQIVFDRSREISDIVSIDLPGKRKE